EAAAARGADGVVEDGAAVGPEHAGHPGGVVAVDDVGGDRGADVEGLEVGAVVAEGAAAGVAAGGADREVAEQVDRADLGIALLDVEEGAEVEALDVGAIGEPAREDAARHRGDELAGGPGGV